MKSTIQFLFSILASFLIIGCGPDSSGSGNYGGVGTGSGFSSPDDINLTQAAADHAIPGYDPTDPVKDQYTAVINYLRSLSVTCHDAMGLSGPVGVDLSWNGQLTQSAFEHSKDMNISGHYDHTGSGTSSDITGQTFSPPRSSTFTERIQHNGYSGSVQAENIARSKATGVLPADYWLHVMEGWMASPHGHCSNIMNPALTDFGMSEVRSGQKSDGYYYIYWTQDFGGEN